MRKDGVCRTGSNARVATPITGSRVDLAAHETALAAAGYARVCGVDEAGRGPLAGPVVAAAVILPFPCPLSGIDDSKRLSPAQREALYEPIMQTAVAVGVGVVAHDVIDRINILQATHLAMREAIRNLKVPPDSLLLDALTLPDLTLPQVGLIHGDRLSVSIAAASIIAKVTRDRLMCLHHETWPQYNFRVHKGYGTREHLQKLRAHGPCPIHRMTFRGVRT